jgi:hypothetical protein
MVFKIKLIFEILANSLKLAQPNNENNNFCDRNNSLKSLDDQIIITEYQNRHKNR